MGGCCSSRNGVFLPQGDRYDPQEARDEKPSTFLVPTVRGPAFNFLKNIMDAFGTGGRVWNVGIFGTMYESDHASGCAR